MVNTIYFKFKIWTHTNNPIKIETWYQGLEPTNPGYITELTKTILTKKDIYQLFNINKKNNWQIVGEACLKIWHDNKGERFQEFDITAYRKAEYMDS